MSDEDDDYLSNKFLVDDATTSKKPSTYSQLRKEAQKKAHLKNEQNKTKSRRQLELESREEGLSKSLFERAKEEEAAGLSSGNKALSIMMKMGFKPGQSLGQLAHLEPDVGKSGSPSLEETSSPAPTAAAGSPAAGNEQKIDPSTHPPTAAVAGPSFTTHAIARSTSPQPPTATHNSHTKEPLPLQEWAGAFHSPPRARGSGFYVDANVIILHLHVHLSIYLGRKGIGLTGTKRARSPSAAERLAKMAKMANDMGHRDFRERARDEYNNRRAEGRLGTLCFFQILRPGIWRVFSRFI